MKMMRMERKKDKIERTGQVSLEFPFANRPEDLLEV